MEGGRERKLLGKKREGNLLTIVDGTSSDRSQKVGIARSAQATVAVEVGDDPRGVFHGLLVEVTTVVGDLIGEVGVGTEGEGRDVSLDRVAGVNRETVVHVTELTFAEQRFELIVAAGDARRILGHVDSGTAGGGQVTFEVLGPVNGTAGDNGFISEAALFDCLRVDMLDVSETVVIGFSLERCFFPQGDRDVVILKVAGLGQVDLLFRADFGDFRAHVVLVVPGTEIEHVAFSATGQSGTTATRGKFGIEAFGLEFADKLVDFFAARRGVLEGLDLPVIPHFTCSGALGVGS